ncbi:MAG: hypothetical protein M3Y04_03570 [Actinomycetota bacterium]|nr:hypothetical protein [Actinomycetota bacterium]
MPLAAGAQPAAAQTTQTTTASPDWQRWISLPGAVDIVGPRPDGALVAAAGGKLFTVRPDGITSPFSTYATDPAPESYLAMSPGLDVAAQPACRFDAGDVYALELAAAPLGIVRVTVDGQSARFVDLPEVETLTGITFDTTGRFGNRLLVAGRRQNRTVLFSVDCRGRVTTLTDSAPPIEGGIAVAPQLFGEHGGDLVGVDENSGDVVFIRFDGTSGVLVASGLPAGPDVGVEAAGFIPPEYLQRGGTAYMVDRRAPGAPTEGTDSVWRLSEALLRGVNIDNNDLLLSTEAGGHTVVVRCRLTCRVLPLGQAAAAHVEGHITVVIGPPQVEPFNGTDPKGTLTFVVTTGVLVAGGFVLFFIHRKRAASASTGT